MSDEFGGIPVDEPQTDEFGGVAVAEPQSMPPVSLSPYEKYRLSSREPVAGPFGPANPQEVLALGEAAQRPFISLPDTQAKGPLAAAYRSVVKPVVEGIESPLGLIMLPALAESAPLRVAAGIGFGGLAAKSGLEKMQSDDPQTQLEGRMELAGAPFLALSGGTRDKVAPKLKVTPEALPAPREAIPEVKPESQPIGEIDPLTAIGNQIRANGYRIVDKGGTPHLSDQPVKELLQHKKIRVIEDSELPPPMKSLLDKYRVEWDKGLSPAALEAKAPPPIEIEGKQEAAPTEEAGVPQPSGAENVTKVTEPWTLTKEQFAKEPEPDYPATYKIELDAVANGVKPAHYGFYPSNQPWSKEVYGMAKDLGLYVKKGPRKNDYIITKNTEGGRSRANTIFTHVKDAIRDPSLEDDVLWHDRFGKLLGYGPEFEGKIVAISGPKELENTRLHKYYVAKALREGKPVPANVKAQYPELSPAAISEGTQPSAGPVGATVETPVTAGVTPQAIPESGTPKPTTQETGVTGGVTEPPGPGAQTPGEPEYSAISQLTDRLKATPKVGLSESIPLKERAAEAWSEGKSGLAKSISTMRAVTESLKETAKGVRDITELDRRVGEFDRAIQTSAGKSKESGRAIERQIPNKSIRDAVALWVDAGGDEKAIAETLSKLPEGTKPRIRRALEMAAKLPPEAKQFAQDLKQFFSIREQDAMQGELFEKGLEDYYTHIWEKEGNMPEALRAAISNGKLSTYFQFARQRKIPQLLQGILEGKTPILDPAKVVPFYNYAMDRALASRKFIREASESVEKDGRPTLSPSGKSIPIERGDTPEGLIIKPKARSEQNADYRQIDHPALRKWKWAGTDQNGKPIIYQSDLLVHPDAYDRLANMLDRGRLSPTKIGRALLAASTEVKGFKLGLLSAFHVVHVGSHAMWHWTSPFKALELGKPIEWDSPRVQFAIEKGHLKIAPDPAELKVLSEGLMGGGLVHKIPLIGPISRVWSEWTFGDFIPKLKLATFDNALKRNMENYAKDIQAGKITPDQIASRVGDSVNNAYGELNHLFLGKFGRDPRFQRLLRGIFLAPDFGEARLRFVEKAFTKYGFEERLALLTMFTTMYVGARVANWITHGDPEMDWKKAFSVKSGEHWYSMRSVIGDLDRAASDFGRFMYVRLNPLYSRTLADFLFGRDVSGRKLTVGEKFGNIGKQLVPIQFGGLTRDDQKLWESFVTAMGVSTIRDRPEQDVHRFVNDWMKNNPDPKIQEKYTRKEAETFARSQYFPLRFALENEDYEKARNELSKLTKTHNQQQITKAMSPEFKAFGGLNSTEFNRFLKSMTPEQRKLYNEALENRKLLYRRYLTLIHPKTTREE